MKRIPLENLPNSPSEIALYWFLKCYEQEHGKAYEITTQAQLARDCLLRRSTITALKQNSEYFNFKGATIETKPAIEQDD